MTPAAALITRTVDGETVAARIVHCPPPPELVDGEQVAMVVADKRGHAHAARQIRSRVRTGLSNENLRGDRRWWRLAQLLKKA